MSYEDFIKDINATFDSIEHIQQNFQTIDYDFSEKCLNMYLLFRGFSAKDSKHKEKIIQYTEGVISGEYLQRVFLRDWIKLQAA